MTHRTSRSQRQQTQQRCTVCLLFQSMGKGQYRSSYDREMYLHHLQTAHAVGPSEDEGKRVKGEAKGGVAKA
jgi:hypothetical protein